MKRSAFQMPLLLAVSLVMMSLPALHAEARCPANVAGVSPRFVRRTLIVIPVKINQAGPFDFMVDTGSQINVVDPSLASQLGLKPQGVVGLVSVASYAHTSIAVLDTLEAASHMVERPLVLIQDLAPFQAADSRIRGVLGVNFLAHFDFFIDYQHKLLCLDDTRMMRDELRGEHIPLVAPQHPENELPFTQRLVIPVHLSGAGSRQVLLQLDSGSDGPILYASRETTKLRLLESATLRGSNVSQLQRAFAVLPPQEMRIGTRTLDPISFVTPVSVAKDMPTHEEDGLLPTLLFQRIYISAADGYVIFDPH
jgi:hypothetical protein